MDMGVPTSKLNQVQYETILQEIHDASDLNMIHTTVHVVRFEDEAELQEVKTRAAKTFDLCLAFTPSKKAKIVRDELGLNSDLLFYIEPIDQQARISFVPIGNAGQVINLQGSMQNDVLEYITILEKRLPALQHMVSGNWDAAELRFVDVDDELGLVVADMG
jgi:hypothetical protein